MSKGRRSPRRQLAALVKIAILLSLASLLGASHEAQAQAAPVSSAGWSGFIRTVHETSNHSQLQDYTRTENLITWLEGDDSPQRVQGSVHASNHEWNEANSCAFIGIAEVNMPLHDVEGLAGSAYVGAPPQGAAASTYVVNHQFISWPGTTTIYHLGDPGFPDFCRTDEESYAESQGMLGGANSGNESLQEGWTRIAGSATYGNEQDHWTVTWSLTPLPDRDHDGVPDAEDNCPDDVNPNQENNDGDALGDVCDPDDDNGGTSDVDEIANGTNPFDPSDDGPYTLTVSVDGDGTVTSSPARISCPPTCSALFAPGTNVSLNASAGGGSTFSHWGGDCAGTNGCNVAMNGNKSVTATFNPNSCGPPNTGTTTTLTGGEQLRRYTILVRSSNERNLVPFPRAFRVGFKSYVCFYREFASDRIGIVFADWDMAWDTTALFYKNEQEEIVIADIEIGNGTNSGWHAIAHERIPGSEEHAFRGYFSYQFKYNGVRPTKTRLKLQLSERGLTWGGAGTTFGRVVRICTLVLPGSTSRCTG